jgi:hypothetical protein
VFEDSRWKRTLTPAFVPLAFRVLKRAPAKGRSDKSDHRIAPRFSGLDGGENPIQVVSDCRPSATGQFDDRNSTTRKALLVFDVPITRHHDGEARLLGHADKLPV